MNVSDDGAAVLVCPHCLRRRLVDRGLDHRRVLAVGRRVTIPPNRNEKRPQPGKAEPQSGRYRNLGTDTIPSVIKLNI
jgi:hypothetical protein